MWELIAGVVVAFAAVGAVLEPLLSRKTVRVAPADRASDIELTELEESDSPKVQALLALREIEFDRATGKLSEDDYAALKAKYSAQALAAIKDEDQQAIRAQVIADPAEAAVERARQRTRMHCPHCGPRPEPNAVFCSGCGRRLRATDAQTHRRAVLLSV